MEVIVAASVLAITTVVMTQSMLVLNRNSALSRVRNLAKAMVLGRIQEVGAVAYDPAANPAVVPAILTVGTTTSTVNLGDASAQVGAIPATLTWTVGSVGTTATRSVKCRVDYTYMNRKQNYEALTFRSPD